MDIKEAITKLSKKQQQEMLVNIHNILWDQEDKDWNSDTLSAIVDVYYQYKVHPVDLQEIK